MERLLSVSYESGPIDSIQLKPRDIQRICFSYNEIQVCGYYTDLSELILLSYRCSFFVKDAFGKLYKTKFTTSIDNRKYKQSRITKKEFTKIYLSGKLKLVSIHKRCFMKRVISENVTYIITIVNTIALEEINIYVLKDGSMSQPIAHISHLPVDVLTNEDSLYQFLISELMQRQLKTEFFYVTPLNHISESQILDRSMKTKSADEIRREILKDKAPHKTIFNWILLKQSDGQYLGWSKAKDIPKSGRGMIWERWGKTLPYDIGSSYYFIDNKLKKRKGTFNNENP